jgi:hypothetical protein
VVPPVGVSKILKVTDKLGFVIGLLEESVNLPW